MSKQITVTLTWPQAAALLSAVAEIQAGAPDWPAPEWRALLNAERKISDSMDKSQA